MNASVPMLFISRIPSDTVVNPKKFIPEVPGPSILVIRGSVKDVIGQPENASVPIFISRIPSDTVVNAEH